MLIELRGVEFVNKGAELMLHAIMQQVREKIPDAIFAMEIIERAPVEKLREYNIHTKKNGIKAKWVPKFIRKKLKIVLNSEIDVVLDASGFAFGDQWGAKYADKRIGSNIGAWRKDGKKVILLPQAFGPFDNEALKVVMKKILANADLVFAREEQSYNYLKGLSDKNNVVLSPDFTNLLKAKIPVNFDTTNNQVPIIPNYKMIKKRGDGDNVYTNFLYNIIENISAAGLKPYFLILEGDGDVKIAKKINTLLEKPLDIVINPDPILIKGMISAASFIVSARYHGVVCALSQGIPCITTSWSHKYEMLHQEYDYEEGLLNDMQDDKEITEKVVQLSDPETNKKICQKLLLNSVKQKKKSHEMWSTVFKVIAPEPRYAKRA